MGLSDQQFDCSNSHVAEKPLWVGCGCRSQTGLPESNFRFRCYRTPYGTDMEHGSENPADPPQTVGVLTIMLVSEYWPQPGPYASAAPYAKLLDRLLDHAPRYKPDYHVEARRQQETAAGRTKGLGVSRRGNRAARVEVD
jgi:hypothetical protein